MAFTIFGRVAMDGRSVSQAFTRMGAAAAPAGKKIGEQLRGAILSVVGAGAGVALFKRQLENAFNIRRDAGRAGIDTSTFQVLKRISDETGASIEDLTERLRDGGPAGDEFRQAVADATAEMLNAGQIIDSDTVQKLAELRDKMTDLFARLAPGLAWLVEGLIKLYDIVDKFVHRFYGLITMGVGRIRGDADWEQAGREMWEGRQTQEQSSERTGEDARRIAREMARAAAEEGRQTRSQGGERRAAPGAMQVSGATSVGASFAPVVALTPMERHLILLNRQVADIRRNTMAGRLLD